jgi:hypothetical protein
MPFTYHLLGTSKQRVVGCRRRGAGLLYGTRARAVVTWRLCVPGSCDCEAGQDGCDDDGRNDAHGVGCGLTVAGSGKRETTIARDAPSTPAMEGCCPLAARCLLDV